ncbi:hypothetical protein [Methanobrevibacter sp.]|uniref:hypothetical protein n=1 Tax=Methanobrevibacter sp. TaxID=66852 RepID=UPI00386E7AFF
MIDYENIAKFYLKICSTISKTIYESKKNEETQEDAKKDFDSMYWSFDRATSRANDVLEMHKYWNEHDFEHYGLEQLSSTRHRIEHFLDDCLLNYPDCCYTFDKYDDIIIDYYKPIRLEGGQEHHEKWKKYYNLNHKRVMINYGLVHELNEAYNYVNGDEKSIIDEMMELCKKLDGYDEEMANDY